MSQLLQIRPHLVDEGSLRFFLFLRAPGAPCPDSQKPDHVHPVDFIKPPSGFHQRDIGRIDVVGQRQASFAIPGVGIPVGGISAAPFVGKSESTSVVCV